MDYTIRRSRRLPNGAVDVWVVDQYGASMHVYVQKQYTTDDLMHTVILHALASRLPRVPIPPLAPDYERKAS